MDDNLFDEDDALDYIFYEELEDTEKKNKENAGCLTVYIFFFLASCSLLEALVSYN